MFRCVFLCEEGKKKYVLYVEGYYTKFAYLLERIIKKLRIRVVKYENTKKNDGILKCWYEINVVVEMKFMENSIKKF